MMSEVRDKNYHFLQEENEPPPKKLISDADILIKQLSAKQRNTVTSLQEQLEKPKEFVKNTELTPLSSYNPGTSTLKDFQENVQRFNQIEFLKAAGLLEEDIQFYVDGSSNMEHLFQKHKNYDKALLLTRFKEIKEIIENHTKHKHSEETQQLSRHDLIERGLSVKPDSVETKLLKFALSVQKGQEQSKALPFLPMNNITKIESERFGYLKESPLPNIHKIRRKARKLVNRLNNEKFKDISHTPSEDKIQNCSLARKSLWDSRNVEQVKVTTERKVYTCLPRNYYTIKDGQIFKLNNDELQQKNLEIEKRFTVDDIRNIPKFNNYEIGLPSKILYLRNLSSGVKEEDIRELFNNFNKRNDVEFKLMQGKMRGQAFVTFPDEKVAAEALNGTNGVFLRNKPIVMQFGHKK